MKNNKKQTLAIVSFALILAVALFVFFPLLSRFIQVVDYQNQLDYENLALETGLHSLKQINTISQKLEEQISNWPYKVLDPKDTLLVIKAFEDVGETSNNKLTTKAESCETGQCFTLETKGNFEELLNFFSLLEKMPYAHSIESVKTRWQERQKIYHSETFIRVYTTDDL